MKKSYISPFLMLVVLLCTLNTKAQLTQQCILPDNGSGTAALPPIGCEYTCSSEPFYIIDGLPAGTTIEFWGTLNNFVCCPWGCDLCTMPIPPGECEAPGGTMGGDGHCFEAVLEFEVIGTGALAGFQRTLQLPVFGEVHTGPRIAGEPVQEFLTLFYQLTGLLYGDPDFCSLNLVAGENYGLPSPGQTILTSNGPESWWVESFFDITYQIEFEGCPGSMLEGFSGITTGTTRIETGENGGGSNVSDLFLRVGDWVIDEDWHNWIGPDPVELQLFVNDPEHIISKVNFYYSLDGIAWTYIGTDDDGSQPEISTTECTVNDGDGWQISWYPEGLPPDDLVVYLMAEAVTQDGTTYEVTNSKKYDPTPPNGINTNMTDWLITTDDFILLEVEPGTCEDLDYIWVEIVPKADSFQKGIPPISQQPHSSSHCSPTAAAACLKYFEGEGDTTIAGGLSDYDLVDALAGRFHTNDGHWGTYLSDIANGLRSWINDHGGGYTVRGPMDYDWETMRNELERCQDVMSSIYWDGGCGHSMTFNSIINTPNPDGSIRVDFMDPWTGEIEWGDMNTGTGHVSGFTGAGASGTMGDMIIVCPEEPSVTPGGGTIFPWPYPGGITIPFPGDGLFFLRIIAVDAKGHAARHDYVVKKETASLVSDPVLCIDDYINPEPWNDWFGVDNNDLPVVFLVSDPQNEITHVDFFYSLDGAQWLWYFTDDDGSQPLSNTFGTAVNEGDGWSSLFPIAVLPADDMDVHFKATAFLQNGETVEAENSSFFNTTPPSLIQMNVEDWISFEEDYILLEVLPGLCTDLSYIEVELVPKADTFQKGIPPMYQRTHSDFHCTPTAAAACLKYYANQGDGTITGGLSDDDLIEALANLFWTWFYQGTYPSDLANGLRQWINAHGGNYTVTRPLPFNWQRMRNELERCQDVITNIYWPGGGGHSMTFNSIVNRPVGGKIKVDFMDPWTGQIEYGWIDPATGQITGFTGAGTSGELDNIVYVCPKESNIIPGTGTIIPGPTPMPMPIPVPAPGLYFLRIKAVDNSNNVARFDFVVERLEPTPQIDDLHLRIGDWLISEDWHDWIGGTDGMTEVQLFVNDPDNEIAYVNFYYSTDGGVTWQLFYQDDDGTQAEMSTEGCTTSDGDGWLAYFSHDNLPPDDLIVYFRAEAVTQDGLTYEATNSSKYDPTPPNGINTSMTDWLITTDDFILLEVEPGTCEDLDYIWVEIVPKVDSFQKGIPPISQQPHSSSHCSPTAAAGCLKYFEGQGDTIITGGLSDFDLVEALAGRFHTNDGHWGTYLSDIANGLRDWINNHGGGYTVRGPMNYNWNTMRNELERCQDVISSIYWDGGCGHSMTFNSIINTPNADGSITVDFMDPWTGQIEWGNMNTNTGHISGFTGAGTSGTMSDMIIVCPEETSVTPGGGTIYPGPFPGGITIPIPGDGQYFLRIISVDDDGNAARLDYVVKKETASQVSEPALCIKDYLNPEPWNDWFGIDNPDLPVVFLASDPESEITQVDFLYSLDGLEWMWYFTDNDGTQPLSNTFGTAVDEGNGWSSLFPIELLPIEDMDVYFKAVATLENGDAVEVEASSFFNISPPSLIEMNVEDWMSFEEDYILLEVLPGLCTDLSYIEVELVPKADTFQKGIPPMYQRTHSDFHCTPTAAAACLKYYANQGDGTITGGLTDDELIEALAELFWTWFYEGTYPSDLANGLRQWINTHGGNYVVTRPLPFNWRHMRNELERCQDVITNIYWPGGGGHSMTFNSIVNRPVGGKIKVDFMDPWTGQIEYGWIDPNTGQITGFTGAGTSGELDNIVYVCPKEPSITPGTGTIIPGPTPMPMPIPVPNPGLYFLRIKAVDNSNNVARFDLVVERKSPQLNYIDPGEDQWTVPWGRFNFGVGEELPPLPADFFFPGSEPFEGQVDFIGLNSEGSQLPEADVIINRLDPAEFPEPLPSTQSVPTEIVALELRSTEPILVQGQFPVDSFFDVFTELSVEAPQQGTCNITLEDALGGIFEKQTSFHLTFTFVKTDDPTHIIEWDSWEQGIPELSFYSESPYGFNLPPKPNQFDPVGEDYFILRTELGSSLFLLPLYQREDAFFVEVNEAGVPILWEGTGFNGNAWYYYEFTDWWNAWFFDHPLDNERRKIVDLNIDLLPANPEFPSNATIVYNWSTNQWPGWPEIARPPLPADLLTPEMEGLMITRSEPVFDGFLEVANDLSISDHFEFLDFNPEWFSMDIRGSNYILSGTIKHVCFKEGERPVGVGDLFLGINHYVNPSPWQNWFGGIDDTTHVELFAEDTANLISYVEFYHSQDGMNWTLFGTDYDGNSVILGYDTLVQGELDGWSAYLSHVSLPLTDMTVYFAAKAFLTNGETLLAENSADYDVSPPDAIEPGVDDWMQTPLDHFMLNINPGLCFDLDHAIVKIEAIADSFAKGIPPISQHLLSGTHCAPTSAAACFKYFESKGDTNICGGRNDSSLVYILGKKAYTSKKGTKAANLIKTLREWQKDHGNNYNVSLSKKFNWKKMRDELMRCQDVLVTIDWPNSKMNHMMTFNSIVQRPKGGKIRVDFMDPWTGAIEYADLDPESGNVTNLTGNEQPRSGKLINVIYICPKEPNPNGGGGGNQVPGPNPDPLLIPLPNPGLYKLSIVAVDEMEHSARFDFIIERTALDWGDAPDPTYPTLAASNGPSHGIDYITYLGDTIDGELNGLPDAFALGDDLNNVDDEDGVKFLNSLVVGKDAIINVKPSSDNAYLNVWIDLDRNGNFSAANEHVVVELMPAAGSLDIVIPIPASASTGETFARFRYSTQPNLSYEGPAENGEVEDYKVFIHEPTNHKMHFPQFPKLNGWDVNFTVPYVLADDWMCSESGEIGNMQFWISLLGDMGAFELDYCIDKIYLSIHTDIPASESPSGFSMPADPPLWERTIVEGDYTWDHYFEFPQGWYSPYEGVVQPNDHYHCFRINIDNIEDPFVQQEGTIYWLRISMLSKYPDQFFFGWKSAIEQWNDNAVYNYPFPGYPPDDWMELYHPYNDDEPMDLSFVISPAVNCPTADAGPDATICPDSYYMLYGSATNYLSVTWGTSGDGTFDDPTLLNPAYAPGTMDLANGSVILCLSAAPIPPCTQPAISCMTLTFAELQSYTLFKGYRGFSSYLVPLDPDIENMFDPLVSNGLLGILYSYSGFYWPDQYINSLTWDEYSGYVLKTNGDTEFSICGEEVMNKNIVLNATSWNLIPVLSRNGVDVVSLFQTLNGFFVVKEVAKWNVYWPMFNINTIGTVVPGSAYEVYTTNGGTITYPTSSDNVTYEKPAEFVNNTPWNDVIYSLNSHVVGFDPDALGVLENGDIVGAFTSAGLCAGMVEYSGDGVCLVIAGDDPYTQHVDGFEEDEYLTFKLYRPSTSVVYDMDVVYEPSLDNSGQFHSSGISAITQLKLDAAGVDDRDTDDLRIYPNPTKGIFTIEGFESEAELSIFTSFGKEVYQKVINQAERIDLRTLPNGVYLVKVTDAKKTYYDKLILKK